MPAVHIQSCTKCWSSDDDLHSGSCYRSLRRAVYTTLVAVQPHGLASQRQSTSERGMRLRHANTSEKLECTSKTSWSECLQERMMSRALFAPGCAVSLNTTCASRMDLRRWLWRPKKARECGGFQHAVLKCAMRGSIHG